MMWWALVALLAFFLFALVRAFVFGMINNIKDVTRQRDAALATAYQLERGIRALIGHHTIEPGERWVRLYPEYKDVSDAIYDHRHGFHDERTFGNFYIDEMLNYALEAAGLPLETVENKRLKGSGR